MCVYLFSYCVLFSTFVSCNLRTRMNIYYRLLPIFSPRIISGCPYCSLPRNESSSRPCPFPRVYTHYLNSLLSQFCDSISPITVYENPPTFCSTRFELVPLPLDVCYSLLTPPRLRIHRSKVSLFVLQRPVPSWFDL